MVSEAHLRPGHYIVKCKEHGTECLRCGLRGSMDFVKSKACTNPTGTPAYPDEEVSNLSPFKGLKSNEAPKESDHDQLLLDEMEALRLLEEDLAMMNAIQSEQEELEALQEQLLNLDLNSEAVAGPEAHRFSPQDITEKLVEMGFPKELAAWAAETSDGDWDKAVDQAYIKIQEQEHQELLKAEAAEEEEKKAAARVARTSGRPPASPQVKGKSPETSMPPPRVPAKKVSPTPVPMDAQGSQANILATSCFSVFLISYRITAKHPVL